MPHLQPIDQATAEESFQKTFKSFLRELYSGHWNRRVTKTGGIKMVYTPISFVERLDEFREWVCMLAFKYGAGTGNTIIRDELLEFANLYIPFVFEDYDEFLRLRSHGWSLDGTNAIKTIVVGGCYVTFFIAESSLAHGNVEWFEDFDSQVFDYVFDDGPCSDEDDEPSSNPQLGGARIYARMTAVVT